MFFNFFNLNYSILNLYSQLNGIKIFWNPSLLNVVLTPALKVPIPVL